MQVTYDIYKPFFKPKAGGRHLLIVSRIMVAVYGLVMACVSVIFNKVSQSFEGQLPGGAPTQGWKILRLPSVMQNWLL